MDMLEWGERKDKGWARYHDERVSGGNNIPAKPPKQLTPEQKSLSEIRGTMQHHTRRKDYGLQSRRGMTRQGGSGKYNRPTIH